MLEREIRKWPHYWYHGGHFIVRWSSTGLWYVDDKSGHRSLRSAVRRIDRMEER